MECDVLTGKMKDTISTRCDRKLLETLRNNLPEIKDEYGQPTYHSVPDAITAAVRDLLLKHGFGKTLRRQAKTAKV